MHVGSTIRNPRDHVAELLRQRIVSGQIAPGGQLEPVRVLAQTLKRGQATVVRAIERLVGEGYLVTRDRKGIFVSQPSAWQPVARNVAILTGVPTRFSSSVLSGAPHLAGISVLQDRLVAAGERVSLHGCVFYPSGPVIRRYTPPRNLALDHMDAIVAAGLYELAYLGQLLELEIPVIAYDVDASAVRIDSVFTDELDAAFRLTQALLERGHKEILFWGGPQNAPRRELHWNYDPCNAAREDGYRLAMRQRGLPERVRYRGWDGQRSEACETTEPRGAFTAIVTTAMPPAEGLAPRKLELASWTNQPVESWPESLVLAAGNDQNQMGEAAAELLRWRLDNPGAPVQRRTIRVQITERNGERT